MQKFRDILAIGKGVDESLPPHLARAGSFADCKNVRLLPPHTRRRGAGKRAGLVLAFLNAVGQATAGPRGIPVTGAIRCTRAANQTVNLDGNYINVDDDFRSYSVPNVFGGTFQTGTDFRGKYVVFSHRITDGTPGGTDAYAEKNPSTGVYPNAPYVPANSTDVRSLGRELRITSLPNSATHNYGLAVNYATTNRIKATIKILGDIFGNTGADFPAVGTGQCTNLGLFVRGSETLGNFICGYIKAVAVDQVQLVIETHENGLLTTYTSSTTHNLSRGPGPSILSLELVATASSVSLRFLWGDQEIDETYNLSDASPGTVLASENRAGLIYRHAGTNTYRSVTRLEYTTLVPLEKVVKYGIRATDADPTQGRWQIPKGWDSVYITDATIQGHDGATAYIENGATPTVNYPMIDRVGISPASGAPAEAQIYGGQTNGTTGEGGVNNGGALVNRTRIMFPTAYDDTTVSAMTKTADVELEWNDTDGTIDNAIGAAFRIDGISGTY